MFDRRAAVSHRHFVMTSSRPYLVRAFHEWIVDNGLTPQLVVDATIDGVVVPEDYVQDGKIVLNIATRAIRNLDLGNEYIRFGARFSGRPFEVELPTRAVLAVYAAENGVGMAFQAEDDGDEPPPDRPTKPERPSLKVVK